MEEPRQSDEPRQSLDLPTVTTLLTTVLTLMIGLPAAADWGMWAPVVALGLVVCAAGLGVWCITAVKTPRAKGLLAVLLGTVVLTLGFPLTGRAIGGYRVQRQRRLNRQRWEVLNAQLYPLNWIGYEPRGFVPGETKAVRLASETEIRDDLRVLTASEPLRRRGIGLITFSGEGTNSAIPRIACERPFRPTIRGVIMGIQDLRDQTQVEALIAARDHVTGYCVGHVFTDRRFVPTEGEVVRLIKRVQRDSGKPVTTTLRPSEYRTYRAISETIDFFFPDVHTNWYDPADAAVADAATTQMADAFATFRDQCYPGKPILLKMVSFPSKDSRGATEGEQQRFYRDMMLYRHGALPGLTHLSYNSAFDLPWKDPLLGWWPGEQWVGLFRSDGTPKAALKEFLATKVPIQGRLRDAPAGLGR